LRVLFVELNRVLFAFSETAALTSQPKTEDLGAEIQHVQREVSDDAEHDIELY
jgi:hypothetical protein